MLELFTDRARQVVAQASESARVLGHEFIGAEHLLLGLIAERHGTGARALQSLGVSDEAVRRELLARHPQGDAPSEGGCRSTRRAGAFWSSRSRRPSVSVTLGS